MRARDRKREMYKFMADFATMIDAGLPLVQALTLLEESYPVLAKTVKDIREKTFSETDPLPLATAVRAHPEWFDEFSCAMIAAGEVGGILDFVLNKLASQLRRDQQNERRCARMRKAPPRGLLQVIEIERIMRMLGMMLSSGVPILDAMGIVAKATKIKSFKKALTKARDAIMDGRDMCETLVETKVFPLPVVQMIAVGKSTGSLDQMFLKIADRYRIGVDDSFDDLGVW